LVRLKATLAGGTFFLLSPLPPSLFLQLLLSVPSTPGSLSSNSASQRLTHLSLRRYNQTNFDYTMKVVSSALDFIAASSSPTSFTFSPGNEMCDDFSKFATPETVSYPDGVNCAFFFSSYF
jgi:hypothetical protein